MKGIETRWMIRRDMDAVLAIEAASFEFPWTEDDFIRALRQRTVIGQVAEVRERVVGFMVYDLYKTRIQLCDLAVHPDYRRQGVGTALVDKLKGKLSKERRSRISLNVPDALLPAQLFLRAMDFRCVRVVRGMYDETDDDAYMFQFHVRRMHDERQVSR